MVSLKQNAQTHLPWIVLAVAVLACGGGTESRAQATAQAIKDSLDATATAEAVAAPSGAAIEAVPPQEEAAPELGETTDATNDGSFDAEATQIAEATAAAAALVLVDLPLYGVDPAAGELAWIHEPETLVVDQYLGSASANRHALTVARDFVMSADITWNTTTGVSGCGFALRSDGNQDAFNQYLAFVTRAGNGTVFFVRQQNGEATRQENIATSGLDNSFQWQNDTTNRLTVVARGASMSVYTNGRLIGSFGAGDFEKGFVAMVALSESGQTVCHFENTWLFLIEV